MLHTPLSEAAYKALDDEINRILGTKHRQVVRLLPPQIPAHNIQVALHLLAPLQNSYPKNFAEFLGEHRLIGLLLAKPELGPLTQQFIGDLLQYTAEEAFAGIFEANDLALALRYNPASLHQVLTLLAEPPHKAKAAIGYQRLLSALPLWLAATASPISADTMKQVVGLINRIPEDTPGYALKLQQCAKQQTGNTVSLAHAIQCYGSPAIKVATQGFFANLTQNAGPERPLINIPINTSATDTVQNSGGEGENGLPPSQEADSVSIGSVISEDTRLDFNAARPTQWVALGLGLLRALACLLVWGFSWLRQDLEAIDQAHDSWKAVKAHLAYAWGAPIVMEGQDQPAQGSTLPPRPGSGVARQGPAAINGTPQEVPATLADIQVQVPADLALVQQAVQPPSEDSPAMTDAGGASKAEETKVDSPRQTPSPST